MTGDTVKRQLAHLRTAIRGAKTIREKAAHRHYALAFVEDAKVRAALGEEESTRQWTALLEG